MLAALVLSLVLGAALASPAGAAELRWKTGETASDGKPVAWPCGTQLVYLYGSPTRSHRQIVQGALKKLNAASSTRFILGGTTTRSPLATGGSDKAVVIGFDSFDAKYAGYAARGRDGDRFVKGYSVMNLSVSYIGNPKTAADVSNLTSTVLHELGHLVGLDHVADDTQVMFGNWNTGHDSYSSGDKQGLAHLTCRPPTATVTAAAAGAPAMHGDGLLARTAPRPSGIVRRI